MLHFLYFPLFLDLLGTEYCTWLAHRLKLITPNVQKNWLAMDALQTEIAKKCVITYMNTRYII